MRENYRWIALVMNAAALIMITTSGIICSRFDARRVGDAPALGNTAAGGRCAFLTRPETNYDAELKRNFKRIRGILDITENVRWWVSGGTLLSALRWGTNWSDRDLDLDFTVPTDATGRPDRAILATLLKHLRESGMIFLNEITRNMTTSEAEILETLSPETNLFITGRYPDSRRGYKFDVNLELHVNIDGRWRSRGPGRWLRHRHTSKTLFPLKACGYFGETVPCPRDATHFLLDYDGGEYGHDPSFPPIFEKSPSGECSPSEYDGVHHNLSMPCPLDKAIKKDRPTSLTLRRIQERMEIIESCGLTSLRRPGLDFV